MIAYSDAAIECRDPRFARPLFDRLVPWADQWSTTVGPTAEGPVSHSLGGLASLLGRYDEADAYFAQSAASSERAQRSSSPPGPTFYGEGCWPSAKLPATPRRPGSFLLKAHEAAVVNGYGNVERRAVAALQDQS